MKKPDPFSLRILAAALALSLLLGGCGSQPEPVPVPEPEPEEERVVFLNPLPLEFEVPAGGFVPDLTGLVEEKHQQNTDTRGWLQVPGTPIDDVVVFYPDDKNAYYLRRGFDKEYLWEGILYADYRTKFGEEGKLKELSRTICIYGHSLSEDVNGPMFGPMKRFMNEDFAREHPYLYFSTISQDLVYEIFAVSFVETSLRYNNPNPDDELYQEVLDELQAYSVYDYNVDVDLDDKIVILSTCTYTLPDGSSLAYPNEYRYVIAAKQVHPRRATKTEADMVYNTNRKAF